MRAVRRILRTATVAVSLGACASPGLPPGGPTDKQPPELVKVTPDSDAVNLTKLREVVFRFDEVVSERPKGAPTLEQLITISPTDGGLSVDWRREAIAVRPKKGWRPNTAYSVTVAPGMTDLAGNSATKGFEMVFSTGSTVPMRTMRGVAFDWVAQKVAAGGRIEATVPGDTVLRWVARVDSTGQFLLQHLPDGPLRLRAYIDQNSNRLLDRTEKWDSATVAVTDTAQREIYLFEHDSLGPSVGEITRGDSLSLKVKFTRPLLPGAILDTSSFRVMRVRDSSYIRVRTVSGAAAFDSLLQRRKRDSTEAAFRSDTTPAGRRARARADSLSLANRADSVRRAQAAEIAKARDTTKKVVAAVPKRAAPVQEVVLELFEPVLPNVPLQLSVTNAIGLSGGRRSSQRQFTYRPPVVAPKDTAKAAPGGKPTTPPATPPATKTPPVSRDTIGRER